MVNLDYLFSKNFVAIQKEALNVQALSQEALLSTIESPLEFQAHFGLFKSKWNLIKARGELLQNSNREDFNQSYQQEPCYVAIYRLNNQLKIHALDSLAFELLEKLFSKIPLGQALNDMENELSETDLNYLSSHLQSWFKLWTELSWFVHNKKKKLLQNRSNLS